MRWYYKLSPQLVTVLVYNNRAYAGKLTFPRDAFVLLYQALNGGKSAIIFVNEDLEPIPIIP